MSLAKLIDALWLPLLPLLAVVLYPLGAGYIDYNFPTQVPALIAISGVMICILLGWRFYKSRAVFVSIILLVAFFSLGSGFDLSNFNKQQTKAIAQLVILLLPLNMLIFALIPERSLFNRYGFVIAGVFILQAIICYWLVVDQPNSALGVLIGAADYRFLPVTSKTPPVLSDLLIVLYAVLLIISLGRMALWGQVIEGAIFVASFALAIASHLYMSGSNAGYPITAAIMAVVLAIVQDSYRMAFIDELTSIPGRRALMNALKSQGSRYAIGMADIDHFKKFNDTYGHDVGDDVLRMVATRLSRVKGGGQAFRYGGEEFTILFPGKSAEEALPYLDDIRQMVASSEFAVRAKDRPKTKGKSLRNKKTGAKTVSVAVSIGVADSETHGKAAEMVMKAADKALYRAKKAGRNRVVK